LTDRGDERQYLSLIAPVLIHCESVSKTKIQEEIYKGKKITAIYFELSRIVGKKYPAEIKVVVKKRGNLGKIVFLSVMKQKTLKSER